MAVSDAPLRGARGLEPAGGIALTRAAAKTPALTLALLTLFVATCELAARSDYVRQRLLAPSVGSTSRAFDVQLAKLDALVEQTGSVDCIFLGSSGVLRGIDPDAFDAAYRQRRGQPIRSFNFGLAGATASDVGALARVLVADYHPRLLVYVAAFRDFQSNAGSPRLQAIPWLQYRSGVFDLDGWLTDHSQAYRYALSFAWAYRSATDPSSRQLTSFLRNRGLDADPITPNGFAPTAAVGDYRVNMTRTQELLAAQFARRGIPAAHLAGLRELLALHRRGVEILVVELPGPLLFSEWLQTNRTYRGIIDRLADETRGQEIPFWRTWDAVPGTLIPDDGWADIVHPNERGAEIFGRWLGDRIAVDEKTPRQRKADYF